MTLPDIEVDLDFDYYKGDHTIDEKDLRDLLDTASCSRDEIQALIDGAEGSTDPFILDVHLLAVYKRELALWDAEYGDAFKELTEVVDALPRGACLLSERAFDTELGDIIDEEIPRNFPTWIEIDYDRTKDNLKMDYSCIEYGGQDYYFRE